MEESQNETININDTVAEITSVISKHLTKVIEQVSSKNNDASQNSSKRLLDVCALVSFSKH